MVKKVSKTSPTHIYYLIIVSNTKDNIIFESTKEVIDYLKTKFEYELPYWAWRRIINEQSNQYGIKVKREEK